VAGDWCAAGMRFFSRKGRTTNVIMLKKQLKTLENRFFSHENCQAIDVAFL